MGKLVIFDLGDVVTMGCRHIDEIADSLSLDRKLFRSDYSEYTAALMEGWCTTKDYYKHVERMFGVHVSSELFTDDYHPTLNYEVLKVISALRKSGNIVVAGSNTFACYDEWNKKNFPTLYLNFDRVYLSNEIHRSKPYKEFFEYIAQKEGFIFDDIYFVDDRKENIESAKALGIHTFLYNNNNAELSAFISHLL